MMRTITRLKARIANFAFEIGIAKSTEITYAYGDENKPCKVRIGWGLQR